MRRKGEVLADPPEQAAQQAGDERHVPHQQQVAPLAGQPVRQDVGRIGGPQPAHHRERGQRVARPAERVARLTRPQLAAVPDLDRRHPACRRLVGQPVDRRAARLGQGPLGVDVRGRRFAVVHQVNHDRWIPRQ